MRIEHSDLLALREDCVSIFSEGLGPSDALANLVNFLTESFGYVVPKNWWDDLKANGQPTPRYLTVTAVSSVLADLNSRPYRTCETCGWDCYDLTRERCTLPEPTGASCGGRMSPIYRRK